MSLPRELQDRVNAAKDRVSLVDLIGRTVKLKRAGREWAGLCPFHQENTPSFTVVPEKGWFHCFGCGAHGDAIGFVMQLRGVDFGAALAELEGGDAPVAAARPARAAAERPARVSSFLSSTEAGQVVWGEARPCAASAPPAAWLRWRGIDPLASGVLDVVRFHPRCPASPWRKGAADRGPVAPAMLAPLCRVEGEPGARRLVQVGVHITYLAADGRGKARLPDWVDRDGEVHARASRQMWGESGRCAVGIPAAGVDAGWPDAGWIDGAGMLVVAEGLESTLSLMARHGDARGGFAALSLNNLQGYALNDGPGGSLRLYAPTPDPERPPFVIKQPGAVLIGVDADMKGLKNRHVQERVKARPVRRDLSGAERSAICGALAVAHWRAMGAVPVRHVRPPMGMDFNDMDRSAA